MSEADRARQAPNPYQAAIARMVRRDNTNALVKFHFADGSTLTFKKVYEIAD